MQINILPDRGTEQIVIIKKYIHDITGVTSTFMIEN
jgi:hypothetical protein